MNLVLLQDRANIASKLKSQFSIDQPWGKRKQKDNFGYINIEVDCKFLFTCKFIAFWPSSICSNRAGGRRRASSDRGRKKSPRALQAGAGNAPGKKGNPRWRLLRERKGRSKMGISPFPFSPADRCSLSFSTALPNVKVTVPTLCSWN